MRTERARRAAGTASAAAAIVLLVGCGPGAMPPSARHPLAGGVAPEFETESTGARTVGVPGGYRTRVIVLDFWASWCPACNVTLPALDALWRDRKQDGVMVIGISVDETEQAADLTAQRLGASFPIVSDPYQRIAGRYGVAKVPLTFVIDGSGTVRWVGRDPSDAERAVEVVLAEGAGPGGRRPVLE
jgi:cytochrome c biogenesis protein CcmG/thiol:disulfide interchange protein DsbE